VSETRGPRCRLTIAGNKVFPTEVSVHQSIHQSADTFYAELPLLPDIGLDEVFWADTAPIPISIDGTNDAASAAYTNLLVGAIDVPEVLLHQRVVKIKGRDNTAALAETKTTQLFTGQTDSEIIQGLAAQVGMTVKFNSTPAKAGLDLDVDYFQELSDQDSVWNVIVSLARKAGCIAFVKGMTVFVQPIDAAPPNGNFTITYRRPVPGSPAQSNVPMLTCLRNLQLAKETTVMLQSAQHQQGNDITSKFNSKPKNASADRLIYTHRAANLTKPAQDKIALSHLKETLSHEREVHAENLPGNVSVVAGLMGLTLKGTGTAFDQDYILADVSHRFSNESGYQMDMSAHSQDASRGEPTQEQ
jgi:hypothetical protein